MAAGFSASGSNPGLAGFDSKEFISMTSQATHPIPSPLPDWTRDLVRLAKTAELRKHALSLQLHTAQILSAQASLDQRKLALEDLKEQSNKLESERARLLDALRKVNEDRDQADMLTATLNRDCTDLSTKIQTLTDGDYAHAKAEVDKLRQEMGQEPLPSLQTIIGEKSAQYLTEIRLAGEKRRKEADDTAEPTRKRRSREKGMTARKNAAAAESDDE